MRLTITISTTEDWDRRIVNNLLANSHSDIHQFLTHSKQAELDTTLNMGDRNYDLKIKIEQTKYEPATI